VKYLYACLFIVGSLLLWEAPAYATDFNIGQCPVASNCSFSSLPINATTYSDTLSFYLGDWHESYGTYQYTSTHDVVVDGASGITPCSGRGCRGAPYAVRVTSATLDGVPMTHTTVNGHDVWTTNLSLSPGQHVIAVTGTASGATWYGRWAGQVQGVTYALVPPPPPPPCDDGCD
jgi:hypothetical protein